MVSSPQIRQKERPQAQPQAAPFVFMEKTTNNSEQSHPAQPSITLQASAEPTRKRRGEAAEAAFLARATYLGFSVCIPWGDSDRYDSVVELDRGFLRVQVKSATGYAENRYRVKTTGASG
ncbi:MAG: group I intron-associated PD-(D/E)XK endonuclease, partial [Candidatus Sulfotelmatobacter sp.]